MWVIYDVWKERNNMMLGGDVGPSNKVIKSVSVDWPPI